VSFLCRYPVYGGGALAEDVDVELHVRYPLPPYGLRRHAHSMLTLHQVGGWTREKFVKGAASALRNEYGLELRVESLNLPEEKGSEAGYVARHVPPVSLQLRVLRVQADLVEDPWFHHRCSLLLLSFASPPSNWGGQPRPAPGVPQEVPAVHPAQA